MWISRYAQSRIFTFQIHGPVTTTVVPSHICFKLCQALAEDRARLEQDRAAWEEQQRQQRQATSAEQVARSASAAKDTAKQNAREEALNISQQQLDARSMALDEREAALETLSAALQVWRRTTIYPLLYLYIQCGFDCLFRVVESRVLTE